MLMNSSNSVSREIAIVTAQRQMTTESEVFNYSVKNVLKFGSETPRGVLRSVL